MFRARHRPSSGDNTTVQLCLIQPDTGHLSEPYFSDSRDIYRTNYFISTIPSFQALKGLLPYAGMIQLCYLLMMGDVSPETCRDQF